MRVLIINTSERVGGAAIAANRLMEALKKQGVKAKMLVRDKQTDRLTVVAVGQRWLQPIRFVWERICIFLANGFSRKNLFLTDIANTGNDITSHPEFVHADVVHLHWTSQGFLSLSDIDRIMHSGKPVVITMHDQWYFTGVCHYSADCERYTEECHHCPLMAGHLLGDVARRVFRRKLRISANAPLTFVGCSQWMADLARRSPLTRGHRVVSIPNAIDTDLFRPTDQAEARQALALPADKQLLLFGCQRITDPRKGFTLLVEALRLAVQEQPNLADRICLVVVGGKTEDISSLMPVKVIPISYVSDPLQMVQLYNAVEAYVTPSLQDNLPNTIMEALACGTPCVGFRVGGIPEMIDHQQNGYVATYRDAQDFAEGIVWTLQADRDTLSRQARNKVMVTYSENAVARKYIDVYEVHPHHRHL